MMAKPNPDAKMKRVWIDSQTEEEILDRYDLIIHLVSVAEDKEEYWNPEGRLETLEEAKALEKRTREAWPDIPKKHVVRNNGGFEEKVEEILAIYEEYIVSICDDLNGNIVLRIIFNSFEPSNGIIGSKLNNNIVLL